MSRKKLKEEVELPILGVVPPNAVDIEERLLGEMLLYPEVYDEVQDILMPSTFYTEEHAHIYTAISILKEENANPNILTVVNKLKQLNLLEKVGGAAKIASLTTNIGVAVNHIHNARILQEKYLRRCYANFSNSLARAAFDETLDIFDTIDEFRNKYENIDASIVDENSLVQVGEIAEIKWKKIEEAIINNKPTTGLQTGYTHFDEMTGGLQQGDMIVWAGRPSMGKTLSAKEIVLKSSESLQPNEIIIVFSLEVSSESLVTNMLCSIANVSLEKIKTASLTDDDTVALKAAVKVLKKRGIYIDDTPAMSVEKMYSKCVKLSKKFTIKMIVADYLQLFTTTTKKGTREQEVAEISKVIKKTAKTVKAPYIALSQLGRNVDKTSDKKPSLSDLRESGQIEQDADLVIFPFRPIYYGITEYEHNNQVISSDNLGVLICAKHRNGKLFETLVQFDLSKQKMYTYGQMDAPVLGTSYNVMKRLPEMKSQFDDFTLNKPISSRLESYNDDNPF